MSDRDDIKQPLDHLEPKEERDRAIEIEEPSYPDTAAEPDKPDRHGVAKLPPTSR